MDEVILAELGDFLLAHSDEIIDEWLRAVERNVGMITSRCLPRNERIDHLPQLLQKLAELLKSPQSVQNSLDMSHAARVHGEYRWRQGYRLEDVICEASIVRRILFHNWMDAFARQAPQFEGATRRVVENMLHQVVDDVVANSTEQFVEEQERMIYLLNSELADALAEVRERRVLTGSVG
jgi:hypothetical protein